MLVSLEAYWQIVFAAILGSAILGGVVAYGWRRRGRPRSVWQWLPVAGAAALIAMAGWMLAFTTNVVTVADAPAGPVATRQIWLGASDHAHATLPAHDWCDRRVPTWIVNGSSRELVLHELGSMPLFAARIPPGATMCAHAIRYLGPADPPPARPIEESPPRTSSDGLVYETYAPGTPPQAVGLWLTW